MTIYALSTGPGISGVAIIRISGPEASNVIKEDESVFRDGIELTRKPSSNFSMSKVRNINMATPTFIFEGECVQILSE